MLIYTQFLFGGLILSDRRESLVFKIWLVLYLIWEEFLGRKSLIVRTRASRGQSFKNLTI